MPADDATTYCLPLCSNVLTGAFMPASGLELPELLAVGLVERREAAVVAADEHEPAGRRDRAAVAHARGHCWRHASLFVVRSSAAKTPRRGTRVNVRGAAEVELPGVGGTNRRLAAAACSR